MKYKIKYRPDRVHQNEDCLSRLRIVAIKESTNESVSLTAKQKEETLCTDIFKYLNNGEIEDKYKHNMPVWAKEIELHFMRNGILYRELAVTSTKRRANLRAQIALPLSLRHTTLNEFHDQPTAGPLAFQRTYLRVQDRFYWPNMHKEIKEYCMACVVCAINNKESTKAPLNPLELTNRPF